MKIVKPRSNQPMPKGAKRVFKGIIFDVYQWQQKMFDGTYQTFEKIKRKDTVLIIPITTDGQIVLIEEEQPGKEKFIATVGGQVDEGENVLAAAKRELLEETGYTAKTYELFDAVQPISKIDWSMYIL